MDRTDSHNRYGRSLSVFPGGVNSPVRAVRPYPFFIDRGDGAHVIDVDGNRYLDYVMGYGPQLLGHTLPDEIQSAIADRVADGVMFGAPAEPALELAEFITDHVRSVEMIRFVNSGTEATTTAVRLARGYTGRDTIVTIGGGYHGGLDATLVSGDPGEPSEPASPGIPPETAKETIQIPFNDPEAATAVFEEHGDAIAAVMVEPLLGNMGCIHPISGYLETLRELATEHGTLLIFDEVMTGFRIGGLECAQGAFGIRPDLTTFAKVIGGGFPVGAVGGRTDIMERLTPTGDVFHASTYAGHPVGMVAGYEMLTYAKENDIYDRMNELGDRLRAGLTDVVADRAPDYTVVGRNSMFKIIFTRNMPGKPNEACGSGCRQNPNCPRFASCPKDATDVKHADGERWERLFWQDMLEEGVFLTANQHESQFLSAAHTADDIERTIEAYDTVLARNP